MDYTSRNLPHSLQRLAEQINTPGEGDPDKIDLDETMVVIATEFGRTPERQGATGLNHWPRGYACLLLGGPLSTAEAGIYGQIDDTGRSRTFVTPAELRMIQLSSLGIYPFSAETYRVSDVQGADDELAGVQRLRDLYLGVRA